MEPQARQNILDAVGVLTAQLEATDDGEGVMDELLLERFGDEAAALNLIFGLLVVGEVLLIRLGKQTGKSKMDLLQEIGLKYSG